jgi:hypothetical protein
VTKITNKIQADEAAKKKLCNFVKDCLLPPSERNFANIDSYTKKLHELKALLNSIE